MAAPVHGALRMPKRTGMMSPNMVLPVLAALEEAVGADKARHVMREARFPRLPEPEEPVRERQVAVLHQAIRRCCPDMAGAVFTEAGRRAADVVITYRIPARSRVLLRRMPWPVATWLLGRATRQFAWTFSGSGHFALETTSRFALFDNPVIRGEHADRPICLFQAALFERLFQELVHPRIICTETACCAEGAEACRFTLSVANQG